MKTPIQIPTHADAFGTYVDASKKLKNALVKRLRLNPMTIRKQGRATAVSEALAILHQHGKVYKPFPRRKLADLF